MEIVFLLEKLYEAILFDKKIKKIKIQKKD